MRSLPVRCPQVADVNYWRCFANSLQVNPQVACVHYWSCFALRNACDDDVLAAFPPFWDQAPSPDQQPLLWTSKYCMQLLIENIQCNF